MRAYSRPTTYSRHTVMGKCTGKCTSGTTAATPAGQAAAMSSDSTAAAAAPASSDMMPAFVPFQLSDEQCTHACSHGMHAVGTARVLTQSHCGADANIYRNPSAFGYPTVRINTVSDPKFGAHLTAGLQGPGEMGPSRSHGRHHASCRLHLRRDPRGERAAPEASRVPHHPSRRAEPPHDVVWLFCRMASTGSRLPPPTQSTSSCRTA